MEQPIRIAFFDDVDFLPTNAGPYPAWKQEVNRLIRAHGIHLTRNEAMVAGWKSESLPKPNTYGWKGETIGNTD